jgi:predicted DNA-binding transcriptional regulator YafY
MKLERLISMIYMLLNNEVLSASVLAEKYEVSQRTIYRDIDAICAAGIPVVSFQGVNGGYGIMESYKMDKTLLGEYDVSSLITILHSMSTVFDDERAQSTIDRLQTIQRDDKPSSVTMDIGSRRAYHETLRRIRTGITESKVIRFGYVNAKNERTARDVEPVRLMYKHEAWYLYGFCQERRDYREFRISRMADLVTTEQIFTTKHVVEEKERSHEWSSRVKTEVELRVSKHALARAMDQFFFMDKTFRDDGSLTLKQQLECSNNEWLLSMILSFGDHIEIIEPAELRQALKQRIEKMMTLYSKV